MFDSASRQQEPLNNLEYGMRTELNCTNNVYDHSLSLTLHHEIFFNKKLLTLQVNKWVLEHYMY